MQQESVFKAGRGKNLAAQLQGVKGFFRTLQRERDFAEAEAQREAQLRTQRKHKFGERKRTHEAGGAK